MSRRAISFERYRQQTALLPRCCPVTPQCFRNLSSHLIRRLGFRSPAQDVYSFLPADETKSVCGLFPLVLTGRAVIQQDTAQRSNRFGGFQFPQGAGC